MKPSSVAAAVLALVALAQGCLFVDAAHPGSGNLVQQAREDLAARLGVAEEETEVAAMEAVDWRDASLGCPEPGSVYAQVITPGYRMILAIAGERHEYHTDRISRVVYCKKMP